MKQDYELCQLPSSLTLHYVGNRDIFILERKFASDEDVKKGIEYLSKNKIEPLIICKFLGEV